MALRPGTGAAAASAATPGESAARRRAALVARSLLKHGGGPVERRRQITASDSAEPEGARRIMQNAIAIALSRQMVLTRQLEITANNIANMNTAGYRAERAQFREFLHRPAAPDTTGTGELSMVIDQAVVRDLRPGPVAPTGNPLDIALQGDGYLVVETPTGPRYSRSGHLAIDLDRRLVDASGLPVQGADGQPIVLPPGTGAITITGTGDVSVRIEGVAGGAGQDIPAGRLRLVRFADPQEPKPLGGGLHVSNQVPEPAPDTTIVQGMVEQSNVQPIVEVTTMIEVQRQYASTQKLVDDEHERLRTAIRRLGQASRA